MSAVEVDGVWKYYGDFPALRNISFQVAEGDCVALLGRNGAARPRCFVFSRGFPVRRRAGFWLRARMPAHTKSAGASASSGTALPYTTSCRRSRTCSCSRISTASPIRAEPPCTGSNERDSSVSATAWCGEFSAVCARGSPSPARFCTNPSVLLLDEPFTALDDRAIAVLQDLLRTARAEGRTIIMSTHQLREALELATNCVLIVRGSGELQRPANGGHARRSRLAVPELRRGVMRLFFRQTLTIALKDLRLRDPHQEALNASVSVLASSSCCCSVSRSNPRPKKTRLIAGGLLGWCSHSPAR